MIPTAEQQSIFTFTETKPGSLIIEARAGAGKCLGRGTPVLLYDGRVVPVEEVRAGDNLMGPDSEPRRVLSVSRGTGPLYRVNPVKGDSWICNDAHILTLAGTNHSNGEVRDISVTSLIEECAAKGQRVDRNWKLWRVGVEFPSSAVSLPIDPYLAGLWLGDGSLDKPHITNCEPEIVAYCQKIAPSLGVECVVEWQERIHSNLIRFRVGARGSFNTRTTSNPVTDAFLQLTEGGEKRIPHIYLVGSRWVRLQILAGLTDTDGFLTNGMIEITTKGKGLAEDILFLARSLGLAAYCATKRSTIKSIGFEGFYNRISISGDTDQIPCLVQRRQAEPRKQIKRVNVTGFDLEPIGVGDYFGFTLDRDGRFLLGDFTVTHNTATIMELLKTLPQSSALLLAFNKRIADEMVKRLPLIPRNRVAHVKTLHAAGLWMLKTKYPRIQVDRNATEALINKAAGSGVSFPIKSAAIKLLQMAKDFQAEENPTRKTFDEIGADSGIFDKISSAQVDPTITIALRAYNMSMQMDQRETIDFCDMGWLPLVLNIAPPSRYKAILLDEAQDVSPNQLTMVKRLLAPGGRIIAVGDRFQTIYGWRGAVGDAVWETLRTEHNAQEMPLTMTFRCSKTVVALANKYVPDLRARPEAEAGAVTSLDESAFMELMLRLTVVPDDDNESIFVLSRTNADLLRIALELWMRGVPFNLAQSADSLIPLKGILTKIRKNGGDRDKTAFRIQLATWYATELQRATSADSATWVERVEEQNKMLMYCLRYAEPRDIERLLESIFAFDESCFITLSTVHKAKGLEANHVYLLRETFQQFQNRVDRNGNPKKIDQSEDNTLYVGITRAQKTLTWVHLNPELQAAK